MPNFVQISSTVLSTEYTGVAISSTGKYILSALVNTEARVYLSTDFGASFSTIPGFINYNRAVAMSSTGQYMVLAVGTGTGCGVYKSSNYGVSWSSNLITAATTNPWMSLSLSGDGKYCIAFGGGSTSPNNLLYISSNFNTASPTFNSQAVFANLNADNGYSAISVTGQYMTVLNYGDTTGIAISSDYGVSFTKLTLTTVGIIGINRFEYITMSSDASTIYLSNGSDGFYKSTNLWSGSPTFTKITSATFTEQTWRAVIVSSDGTYVVASTLLYTYYSSDSGTTWTKCYTGRISYMAMSTDTKYIIASTHSSSRLLLSKP